MTRHLIFGITGASGAVYAQKLLRHLSTGNLHVHLVISPHGERLLCDELGINQVIARTPFGEFNENMSLHAYDDLEAPPASGSFLTEGMVICPCSSNSLGAIAAGLGGNLLHRAAQVTLKEHRRLILLYREMPMSQIDLQNALTLSKAGAIFCPACPGFYLHPESIDALTDFVVGKILDLLNIPHQLNTRWKDQAHLR